MSGSAEVQSLSRTTLDGLCRLSDFFDIEDSRRDKGVAPTIESDQIGREVGAHADAVTSLRVDTKRNVGGDRYRVTHRRCFLG